MTGVRSASLADRELLVHIAAAGFYDDPVLSWVFPDVGRRLDQLRFLFAGLVDDLLPDRGIIDLSGEGCAAFWRDPSFEHGRGAADRLDEAREDPTEDAPMPFSADELERLIVLGETLAMHHPHEPHWYLNVLSTLPERQGRGLGAAALAPGLARCDAEGARAYLESTNPRNRTLYRREGFVDADEIQLPDGPPVLQMWRDPH